MRIDFRILGGLTVLLLTGGCGGHKSGINLPPSFTLSRFQPNYGGDLNAVNYWTGSTITYRFVDPTRATDIHLNTISAVAPTASQMQAVRDTFAKWQAALATNDSAGQRTFVEVAATASANIDVVTQTKDQFGKTAVTEEFGVTEFYLTDVDKGYLGRAVIHLRNDLSTSQFRYNALHEEGHALGIDGHSRKVGSVMFAQELSLALPSDLNNYDKNTIGADYTR